MIPFLLRRAPWLLGGSLLAGVFVGRFLPAREPIDALRCLGCILAIVLVPVINSTITDRGTSRMEF